MKINLITSFIIAVGVAQSAFASTSVCQHEHNVLHCTAGQVDSVRHLGNVKLSGTHVTGQLWVIGNVDAIQAEIGSGYIIGDIDASELTVRGSFVATGNTHSNQSQYLSTTNITGDIKGTHDTFNGKTEITGEAKLNAETFRAESIFTGKVYAESSIFSAPITANTCAVEFYRSKTSAIQVSMQRNCPDNIQKIYIRDKSQINGNISFAGGNGKVYLSKDSAIIGQVTGGTIIRE